MKSQLLSRLKTVEGHTRGLQRMVEEEQYCIDIIRQSMAVQRALERVNALLLENHLASCVTAAIRGDEPAERERVIAELVRLFTGSPVPLEGLSPDAAAGSAAVASGGMGTPAGTAAYCAGASRPNICEEARR